MHDPLTVAFDISIPKIWSKRQVKWLNNPTIDLITVWHVDPCKGGDEDSCDWHGSRLGKHFAEDLESLSEDAQQAVRLLWFYFHKRLKPRSWWRHPKWHVHHWSIQVHPIFTLKRWLFSRCIGCGKRFSWRESKGCVVGSWDNCKPGWFKNAERIYHIKCHDRKTRDKQ